MSIYSIPPLIGALLSFGIGMLVLSNDIGSKVNRAFIAFSFSIAVWLALFSISYSINDMNIARLLGQFGCTIVDFAGVFLYDFVAGFLGLKKERKYVNLTYLFAFCILALSLATPYVFLPNAHKYYWGYYPHAGPLHLLAVLLHFGIMIRTLVLLYRALKNHSTLSERKHNQIKYMYWGVWILIPPGLSEYMPKYGFEMYPLGWMFITTFCILLGYAIVKHQLLDIKIVIRGTLVYSFLAGLITAVFVVTIILLERFFQGFAGYKSVLASTFTAFIIAFSFNPAKNMIQNFIDRYFLKGTAEEIARENARLHQELLKQDKMKAVATLAASMAHEIRNPLTVVKIFTELLPEQHSDKAFIDNFMQSVKPEVEKISYTVQQLLDFSKPVPPNFKTVSICNILQEVIDLLSKDFLKHQIKTNVQFSDEDIVIKADSNQLKQVFMNLFFNAIDAMPTGGDLVITGQIIKYNEKNGGQEDSCMFEINIKDTGCGISKENIRRIFQPFFTTKTNGTGLGLSIINDIIEQHKGNIRVESNEGAGAKFIIQFPALK